MGKIIPIPTLYVKSVLTDGQTFFIIMKRSAMKHLKHRTMKRFYFLSFLLLAAVVRAAEITADQAAAAVQAWVDEGSSMGRLVGAEVDSSATVETDSGARLHIVKFADGGFAVTPADDRIDPIIAFTPAGTDLVQDASNPFWALISGDISARERAAGIGAASTASTTKGGAGRALATTVSSDTTARAQARWAALLQKAASSQTTKGKAAKSTRAAASAVSDIRVDSFVQSQWNQYTHNNADAGSPCYNYYTPGNYVCGCVATAGAQLMRYWRWPTSSVTALTKTCSVSNSVSQTIYYAQFTMQGGLYDWDAMPLVPANGITEAQCQAIGKLTYDIGVSVNMAWADVGSGANPFALVPRLKDTFVYANAAAAVYQPGSYPYSLVELKKAVIPNCDARAPLVMSITGPRGGHAVIVDGYGYAGNDFYMHVNFGWGGYYDAWYMPPDIADFTTINGFVFNVFTEMTGSILSGRVLDAGGAPIAGASVHLQQGSATIDSTTSDANGIYAFIASAGSYVVTADYRPDGITVATASIGVQLASTTGTRLDPDGSWYSTAASIGNSYGNDITITGVAAVTPPVFSPESCLFYPTTNVTITCADADATIHYTLNGSDPTQTSPPYAGPIFVDDTVTIKARAFATGKNPSAIVSATYTYDTAAGAPKGDYFNDPINISGASGTRVIIDNSSYTVETGEPLHTLANGLYYPQYRTVWYKWTAPGSGTMTFRTSATVNGNPITFVAIYTGDTLVANARMAFSTTFDQSSYVTSLSVQVQQGTTYRIVGMLYENSIGAFTLSWNGALTVKPPPVAFRVIVR